MPLRTYVLRSAFQDRPKRLSIPVSDLQLPVTIILIVLDIHEWLQALLEIFDCNLLTCPCLQFTTDLLRRNEDG